MIYRLRPHFGGPWQPANSLLGWLNRSYGRSPDWCFDRIKCTLGMGLLALAAMLLPRANNQPVQSEEQK
ncbi:MAG: hypothetical protein ABSF15_16270 [Candidatus Sulfotelmatobacter sp.]|jgi:hypothetical protein